MSCKCACRPRGLGRKERGHEMKGRGKIVKDEGRYRSAWWHGTNLCGWRRQLPALLEERSAWGCVGLLRLKSGCDRLRGPPRQRCDHGRGQARSLHRRSFLQTHDESLVQVLWVQLKGT